MKMFKLKACAITLAAVLGGTACAHAVNLGAAVVDDGYAGAILHKIINTGKLNFGKSMTLRLSIDDQGHLLECRGSNGADATAACAAAKAASPFGTPPYGVPTYVTIALWNGQPGKTPVMPKKEEAAAKNVPAAEVKEEHKRAPVAHDTSEAAWIAKARRILRNSMYIPAQTKPGTYEVTARIRYDSAGKITESSIVKSSGDKLLDRYCLQGINRAGKVSPPPAGAGDSADITFRLIR